MKLVRDDQSDAQEGETVSIRLCVRKVACRTCVSVDSSDRGTWRRTCLGSGISQTVQRGTFA